MEPRPQRQPDPDTGHIRALASDLKKLAHRLDRIRKAGNDSPELHQAAIRMEEARLGLRAAY